MIQEIEGFVKGYKEDKYAYQVGLKDLDFEINEDKIEASGLTLPFQSIDQAEAALQAGCIQPTVFIEHDDTEHKVQVFDPRPMGYSGFMDCVTHSLALTDHGLFEVGHYPAISLTNQNRDWQWFLHRRLATHEQVSEWQEIWNISPQQLLDRCYEALIS